MKLTFIPEHLTFSPGSSCLPCWIRGKIMADGNIIGTANADNDMFTASEISLLEGVMKNVVKRKTNELNKITKKPNK